VFVRETERWDPALDQCLGLFEPESAFELSIDPEPADRASPQPAPLSLWEMMHRMSSYEGAHALEEKISVY